MGLVNSATNHEPSALATSSQIQLTNAANPALNPSAHKRHVDSILTPDEDQSSEQKRAHCQCAKCGKDSDDCLGNQGKEKCRNTCRDCDQYDCVGRDSRNHKKKCPNS